MASTINKTVARVTREEYRVLYASAEKAKPIIVSIEPGDILRFRELRGRIHFDIAIETAFKYAVRIHALAKYAEKGRKKIERKRQHARR